MKKGLLLALGLGMVLVLGGCGASSSSTENGSAEQGIPAIDDSEVVSDYGDWSEYVHLGAYEGLHINKVTEADLEVSDEALEVELEYVLQQAATTEKITTGTVKMGDVVNIDYEGKKDGVAFSGGTAQGYDLEIGSGSFISGFEEGLVGVNVGDTVDLDLTFPDPYTRNPDLAGAPVVFTVKVNYINGTETVVPELTDEWVAQYEKTECTTVAEFKEEIRETVREAKRQEAESEIREQITASLITIGGITAYPDDLINKYKSQMDSNVEMNAQAYEMEKEDYISEAFGYTLEEYEEELQSVAEEYAARKMVFETIAQKEGITVIYGDIKDRGLEIAKQYGYGTMEEFEQVAGSDFKESLINDVLEKKVIELVKSKASDY